METTEKPTELAQILANLRGDAAVLRRNGSSTLAEQYDHIVDQVKEAAHDYITWLSEDEAAARAGWKLETVRRHARKFANTRDVEWVRGKGYRLRAVIVPRRAHASILEAAAKSA